MQIQTNGKTTMNPLIHFLKQKKPKRDTFSFNFTPHPQDKAYEVTAAQKFGQRNIARLQKLGSGRDRDVYALEPGKVLKIAKNPGGLAQNVWEKDLEYLGQIKHYETGKDYAVMERADKPGKATTQFLRPIKQAVNTAPMIRMGASNTYQKDIHHPSVQEAFEKAGIQDFRDFSDLSVGDLTRKANWGEKEGKPVLIDAGTLNAPSLRKHRVKDFEQVARIDTEKEPPWELKDWREVQRERSQYRQKGKTYPYEEDKYAEKPRTPYPQANITDFPAVDLTSTNMVLISGKDLPMQKHMGAREFREITPVEQDFPGKPMGGFWTSSIIPIGQPDTRYGKKHSYETTGWETTILTEGGLGHFLKPEAMTIKPHAEAKIFQIDTDKDLLDLYNKYPAEPREGTQGHHPGTIRADINWGDAAKDFDAINLTYPGISITTPEGKRIDTRNWDSESTVWFKPRFDIISKDSLFQFQKEDKSGKLYQSPYQTLVVRKGQGVSPSNLPSVDDVGYFYDTAPKPYAEAVTHIDLRPLPANRRGSKAWASAFGRLEGKGYVEIYPKRSLKRYKPGSNDMDAYRRIYGYSGERDPSGVQQMLAHETGHIIGKPIEQEFAEKFDVAYAPTMYPIEVYDKYKKRSKDAKAAGSREDLAESFAIWHPGIGSYHVKNPKRETLYGTDTTSPGEGLSPLFAPTQLSARKQFFTEKFGEGFQHGRTPREEYERSVSPESYIEEGVVSSILRENLETPKTEAEYQAEYEKIKGITPKKETPPPEQPMSYREKQLQNMKIGMAKTDSISQNMAKYYHGTDKMAAFFIEKEGIKSAKDIRKELPIDYDPTMSDKTNPELTYFFKDPKDAKTWARVVAEHKGLKPAVIEVDIPAKEMTPDYGMPFGKAYSHKGSIPVSKVKLYNDDTSKDMAHAMVYRDDTGKLKFLYDKDVGTHYPSMSTKPEHKEWVKAYDEHEKDMLRLSTGEDVTDDKRNPYGKGFGDKNNPEQYALLSNAASYDFEDQQKKTDFKHKLSFAKSELKTREPGLKYLLGTDKQVIDYF